MLTLTASVVSPAVIGAEHIPILDKTRSADSGYIVSYVPKGETFPHMAMTGNRYMYRSGSSFLPMDPWMVADRFGRRPHPKLRLIFNKKSFDNNGNWKEIGLAIKNEGLGIAKYPGFVLYETGTFNPAVVQRYDSNAELFPQISSKQISGQGYKLVILPTRHLEILHGIKLSRDAEIELHYELLCDGFYESDKLIVRWSDLG